MDRVEDLLGTTAALISFGSASLDRVSWLAARCQTCGALVAENGIITVDNGATDCDMLVASSEMVEINSRNSAGPQIHRCNSTTTTSALDAQRDHQ